ncbi:MAG: J domain-containing protein, partial [Verrucomicrobiales bacterium]|nr:J domain-containing protein [Verrucomicrobiales bacterium]
AAEERFKQINEAYDVLGDPGKKRLYDEQLGMGARHAGRSEGPRRGHARPGVGRDPLDDFGAGMPDGAGMGGIFEKLFGRSERGFTGRARGGDVESEITVSLDEVLRGSVRTVTETRTDPTTGAEQRSTFQVRIPPGVREGQMIRVPGHGEPGIGGQAGDLYLRVRCEVHPRFTVRDGDLTTEMVLAPWEAVLGVTLSVPTLDGTVSVKVPPGSRAGQKLRVRGRGLPGAEGARGDLLVSLRVDVPGEVDAEERALWEQLAARSRFRPRD